MINNTTEPEPNPNNAQRFLTLLRILDNEIAVKSLVGIAIWAREAYDCMLHIEKDNNLRG